MTENYIPTDSSASFSNRRIIFLVRIQFFVDTKLTRKF